MSIDNTKHIFNGWGLLFFAGWWWCLTGRWERTSNDRNDNLRACLDDSICAGHWTGYCRAQRDEQWEYSVSGEGIWDDVHTGQWGIVLRLLFHFAIKIIQKTVLGQPFIVISIHINGGVLLGGLLARVRKPCEKWIVLELGGKQEVRIL